MLLNMDVNRVCKTIVVDRMTMLPTNLFLKVYTNPFEYDNQPKFE